MDLAQTAKALIQKGKGLFAADQSTGTITKYFTEVGVESTEESRRKYRQLLFTTTGIAKYISGVILFDETIRQKADDGRSFVTILTEVGIISGIKVDQGTKELAGTNGEKFSEGLTGLPERLKEYFELGARFSKWRAVFKIGPGTPSSQAIDVNSTDLARYAKHSQEAGIVPVVEPEVLIEGSHTLYESQVATTQVLKKVFEKLSEEKVDLTGMLLKPNWVHPGLDLPGEPDSGEVAKATLSVLTHCVPEEVPGIVFLSGGDTSEDATKHLAAINSIGRDVPWEISFSFGRALQKGALKTWGGKDENTKIAQEAFLKQAQLVAIAGGEETNG